MSFNFFTYSPWTYPNSFALSDDSAVTSFVLSACDASDDHPIQTATKTTQVADMINNLLHFVDALTEIDNLSKQLHGHKLHSLRRVVVECRSLHITLRQAPSRQLVWTSAIELFQHITNVEALQMQPYERIQFPYLEGLIVASIGVIAWITTKYQRHDEAVDVFARHLYLTEKMKHHQRKNTLVRNQKQQIVVVPWTVARNDICAVKQHLASESKRLRAKKQKEYELSLTAETNKDKAYVNCANVKKIKVKPVPSQLEVQSSESPDCVKLVKGSFSIWEKAKQMSVESAYRNPTV